MMLFHEIRIPQLFIYLKTLKEERQKEEEGIYGLYIRNLTILFQFLIFFYNNQENKKQHHHKDTLKKWTSFYLHKIDSIKFKNYVYFILLKKYIVLSFVKGLHNSNAKQSIKIFNVLICNNN